MNVTEVPAQTEPAGLAAMLTDAGSVDETVIVIVLDVAGEPVAQPELDVMITVMLSPSASEVVVKVDAVAPPTSVPFTCHWYVGEAPPPAGVAVKVTASPGQMLVVLAEMLTDAATEVATVIVIVLEVAVAGDAQAALDVRITVTLSPLASVEDVNVEAVAPPAFAPFICHW